MAFCSVCKTEVDPVIEHDSDGDGMYVREFTTIICPTCGGDGGEVLFFDEEYTKPYEYDPAHYDNYD